MYARHDLNTKGFVVFYRLVPEDVTNHLRSLSRSDQNIWLHENLDGEALDEHRMCATIPETPSLALTVDLQSTYQTLFEGFTATEWELMKTLAGADSHTIRREFAPAVGNASLDVCLVPGSLYISTQDNTYFYGYGWNHHVAIQSKRQIIQLNRGDLVLFRGDYILVRAESSANNVYIHAFLEAPHYTLSAVHVPQMVAVMNDRRFVDDRFCFVSNCSFRGTSETSLRRHLNRYHRMFFRNPRTKATQL